jgi:hypothetical protein
MTENTMKSSAAWGWFEKAVVILGFLGFFFGVYSYLKNTREPDISYLVNPFRVAVVQSGITSNLSVVYKGVPVTHNVTAMSVQIWNAGRAAVHTESILQSPQT